MSEPKTCPFCGEPAVRTMGYVVFRCGTKGPDSNGEYETGHTCDITTWTREIQRLKAENEKLRKFRDGIVGDYINDGRVVYKRGE